MEILKLRNTTPYTGVGRRACSEASVRFNLKSSGVCGLVAVIKQLNQVALETTRVEVSGLGAVQHTVSFCTSMWELHSLLEACCSMTNAQATRCCRNMPTGSSPKHALLGYLHAIRTELFFES